MNTRSFVAAAMIATLGFAAAPSFAGDNASGEVGYVPPTSTVASMLSRDAVRAEVVQALRDGTLPYASEGDDVGALAQAPSTRNRDGVRAEAVYAAQHGLQQGGEV